MKRRLGGLVVLIGSVTLASVGGCASTSKEMTENDVLKERVAVLTQDLERQKTETSIEREQRLQAEAALAEQQQANYALRERLEQAGTDIEALYRDLGTLKMIDPATDQALRKLAAANPNLIEYDQARGMLRFASDLTFDSGSDVVKSEARQALTELANVLKSVSGGNYEVHIIGHTDSQPISGGTAARHPTNMHLSAHRAISVRRVLGEAGVPWDRMMAAGWADNRPIAPPGPNGNTPANRRVEIFLTAASWTSSASSPTPAPRSGTTTSANERDIIK